MKIETSLFFKEINKSLLLNIFPLTIYLTAYSNNSHPKKPHNKPNKTLMLPKPDKTPSIGLFKVDFLYPFYTVTLIV